MHASFIAGMRRNSTLYNRDGQGTSSRSSHTNARGRKKSSQKLYYRKVNRKPAPASDSAPQRVANPVVTPTHSDPNRDDTYQLSVQRQTPNRSNALVCRDFNSRHGCRRGMECRFLHINGVEPRHNRRISTHISSQQSKPAPTHHNSQRQRNQSSFQQFKPLSERNFRRRDQPSQQNEATNQRRRQSNHSSLKFALRPVNPFTIDTVDFGRGRIKDVQLREIPLFITDPKSFDEKSLDWCHFLHLFCGTNYGNVSESILPTMDRFLGELSESERRFLFEGCTAPFHKHKYTKPALDAFIDGTRWKANFVGEVKMDLYRVCIDIINNLSYLSQYKQALCVWERIVVRLNNNGMDWFVCNGCSQTFDVYNMYWKCDSNFTQHNCGLKSLVQQFGHLRRRKTSAIQIFIRILSQILTQKQIRLPLSRIELRTSRQPRFHVTLRQFPPPNLLKELIACGCVPFQYIRLHPTLNQYKHVTDGGYQLSTAQYLPDSYTLPFLLAFHEVYREKMYEIVYRILPHFPSHIIEFLLEYSADDEYDKSFAEDFFLNPNYANGCIHGLVEACHHSLINSDARHRINPSESELKSNLRPTVLLEWLHFFTRRKSYQPIRESFEIALKIVGKWDDESRSHNRRLQSSVPMNDNHFRGDRQSVDLNTIATLEFFKGVEKEVTDRRSYGRIDAFSALLINHSLPLGSVIGDPPNPFDSDAFDFFF